MLLIGHRGLGADRFNPRLPENTIASLIGAASLPGVAAVEFDVMATLDGVLVLHHDFNIGNILIGKTTLAALSKPLPIFKDFLEKYKTTGKGMICEVKYPAPTSTHFSTSLSRQETANAVLLAIKESPPTWFFVSSFDPDLCKILSEKTNTIFNVWFGHEDESFGEHDFGDERNAQPKTALHFCVEIKAGLAVEISWLLKNEWFVKEAENSKVKLYTYGTENTDREIVEKQKIWGVESVIADCVDRLIN